MPFSARALPLFCLLALAGPLAASPAVDAGRAPPLLFESDDVLEITLPLHFKDLCRPREDEACDFIPTTLSYPAPGGEHVTLAVEIKVRGGWRSLTVNCSAPLLWIRFDAAKTGGTPFAGQELLPLTTHCGQGLSLEAMQNRPPKTAWEQYLLREYLAQRVYGLFTEASLRSRLIRVHYPDPDKPSRIVRSFAFLTEHFDSMAARIDAERLERGSFDHEKLDNRAADILALYQFMIGNTDWSIVRERNIILVRMPGGLLVPVPYDFDMSGLVNAHYAGPAPGLPIEAVRERHFLGFCHPQADWDSLFRYFTTRREAVLELVGQVPGLDEYSSESSRRYLERFFDVLDSPEARSGEIIEACKPWPPSNVDHTTPLDRKR